MTLDICKRSITWRVLIVDTWHLFERTHFHSASSTFLVNCVVFQGWHLLLFLSFLRRFFLWLFLFLLRSISDFLFGFWNRVLCVWLIGDGSGIRIWVGVILILRLLRCLIFLFCLLINLLILLNFDVSRTKLLIQIVNYIKIVLLLLRLNMRKLLNRSSRLVWEKWLYVLASSRANLWNFKLGIYEIELAAIHTIEVEFNLG